MSIKNAVFLLCLVFLPPSAFAAEADPDAAITRAQADRILNELTQIRLLLQRIEQQGRNPVAPPPPERERPPLKAEVSVTDRPVLGEPDAPVTLVEFVDYECAFCRRFFATTYPQLKEEYIDPGRVKLVIKDFPLGFHPRARKAAQAAHCAGEQGAYWPMHDKLFGGSAGLNHGALLAYADEIGLNASRFEECLSSQRHLAQIDADIADAKAAGVRGTPAFVLGPERHGRVEGPHIRGALPFQVFKNHLDRLLEER